MDERSAFLRVALVAGVDHAVALHQRPADRAMGVMAIGAGHLPFQDRVAEGPGDFRALLLVAGEAHFGLGELGQHPVRRVHGVATGAGGAAGLVRAACPMRTLAASRMAGQAGCVLFVGCHLHAARILDSADAPAAARFYVLGRIAVAG